MNISDNVLMHHGILGQKWGVRRFQNPDGSLTAAGKKRYGASDRVGDDVGGASGHSIRDIARRESMETTVANTLSQSGPQAAVFAGFQEGATQNISDAIENGDLTESSVKNFLSKTYYGGIDAIVRGIIKQTSDDMEYVISRDDIVHRMTAYKDTQLSDASRALYVSVNDVDRYGYMAFLKDFNGTGKRYDVSLQAKEKIVAPSYKTARDIFYNLYVNNHEYRRELDKAVGDMLEAHGFGRAENIINKTIRKAAVNNSPFYSGIWAMGKSSDATNRLIDEYEKHGYNAIVDYHDKDVFSKMPIIVFDANNQLVKTGEQFVSKRMRLNAIKMVSIDENHPKYKTAQKALKDIGLT